MVASYGSYYVLLQFFRLIVHGDLAVTLKQSIENGNPVVLFANHFPNLRLTKLSPLFPHRIRGRRKIGQMLMLAQDKLMIDHYFLIRECYRATGFNTADTASHTNSGNHTGGSFDITLADKSGLELDLGLRTTKELNWLGQSTPERNSDLAIYNRKILSDSLNSAGFVNNPLEWWSWSYGDKYWAVKKDMKNAIYGDVIVV